MSAVRLDQVVFDMAIYPRQDVNGRTVERYAEALSAGETLPPIILEAGSLRLLDGMHRWKAHRQTGADGIEVEEHEVPAGVPVKLYAASLSARHGDRMSGEDLKAVAREVVSENAEYSLTQVGRSLGVSHQTVGRWCGDISERRRRVRQAQALLLQRMGWSIREIADQLGYGKSQVSADVQVDDTGHLTDDLLTEALTGLPAECAAAADEIREELVFGRWPEEERHLLKRLQSGETVVVNLHRHANLIAWADTSGLYVRIDRKTPWGNPFEMPGDGDRPTVIESYEHHYLPHKPSLHARYSELRGKALGCWCAPEACHGNVLAREANAR